MSSYKHVLNIIRRHQKFLVTSHHNPDADAISSALAMALFLKNLGKQVHVLNEDACPEWLKFLPATKTLKKVSDVKKIDYEAAIVLDCGDFARVGGVKQFIQEGKPLINIDHHVTNDKFGSINVIDAKASSTCEMIFDLLKEAKHPLNKGIAALLYAGIMTDTGSFRYENTSSHSHAVIEELMAFRISAADMYERLYVGIPVADMKLFTAVIHKAQLLDGNKVFSVALPKKVVDRFSKSFDLKEKLFAFLRSVEGIEVVVILTELNAKEVRINLRSQHDFDVSRLAQQFEGGGHKKAAGCKIYGSLTYAQKTICAAIHKKTMKFQTPTQNMLQGIVLIDKPAGITSHDVVGFVRRTFKMRQIGHAGTLDPMATGVLVVLVGKATKLSDKFVAFDKTYRATLRLGLKTTTADIMGQTLQERPWDGIDEEAVRKVFVQFTGEIEQKPPMVSAVKHKGERLYKIARQGIEVERTARKVRIDELRILQSRLPDVEFLMSCSKGTYVRQLAEDVGEVLGCGACISQIERTKVGPFDIKDAVTLENLNEGHIFKWQF